MVTLRRGLAQRGRGGPVRPAPAACRVGGVDRRAQRRAQRVFRAARDLGVCALRAGAVVWSVERVERGT